MALVHCPDCGRHISDAAPMCIGCGRPMVACRDAVDGEHTTSAAPRGPESRNTPPPSTPKCHPTSHPRWGRASGIERNVLDPKSGRRFDRGRCSVCGELTPVAWQYVPVINFLPKRSVWGCSNCGAFLGGDARVAATLGVLEAVAFILLVVLLILVSASSRVPGVATSWAVLFALLGVVDGIVRAAASFHALKTPSQRWTDTRPGLLTATTTPPPASRRSVPVSWWLRFLAPGLPFLWLLVAIGGRGAMNTLDVILTLLGFAVSAVVGIGLWRKRIWAWMSVWPLLLLHVLGGALAIANRLGPGLQGSPTPPLGLTFVLLVLLGMAWLLPNAVLLVRNKDLFTEAGSRICAARAGPKHRREVGIGWLALSAVTALVTVQIIWEVGRPSRQVQGGRISSQRSQWKPGGSPAKPPLGPPATRLLPGSAGGATGAAPQAARSPWRSPTPVPRSLHGLDEPEPSTLSRSQPSFDGVSLVFKWSQNWQRHPEGVVLQGWGVVRNLSARPMPGLTGVVTALDGHGFVVAVIRAPVQKPVLGPGEPSTFSFSQIVKLPILERTVSGGLVTPRLAKVRVVIEDRTGGTVRIFQDRDPE